ncbi:MAG: UDP-N-acetylmuramate dehydrogenase [Firmicutes bacterium]|nr:UDP-N-acetylmuramate dehydrogenase [Bacillota bacterium]
MEKAFAERKKNSQVLFDVPMSQYTSFRAGGNAAALVRAESMEDLKLALAMVNQAGVSSMVLGNGSNTLFKDSGYDGIVIQLGDYFNQMSVIPTMAGQSSDEETPVLVFSGAAMLMSSLAKFLLRENLTGFEFASGIPGSVGGAAFMNAGAYGGEMKDILVCAHGVSRDGSIEKIFTAEELELSYRHSVLMESGDIITGVMLRLQRGNHQEISVKMKELAEKRNSKQPVQYPSAGSTFKRPEGYFAGKLIEDADLKGVSVGGAQVSTLHSGFVINRGGATATDILDVITLVQNTVYDRFGVKLEPEVRIVG